MDFKGKFLLLLLLLVFFTVPLSGLHQLKVECSNKQFCALKESSVNLICFYSNIHITSGFWFNLKDKSKWREEEHPEDLALDSDYAGRVYYTELTNSSSTLTITDLRERDAGEYYLMLITDKGEKHVGTSGINLTVTDLLVTHDSRKDVLVCKTSCHVTSSFQRYYWYENGQFLENYQIFDGTFPLSIVKHASYSCSLQGHNQILSSSLCLGRSCWNVTYPAKRVCVLRGSSVVFTGIFFQPSDKIVNKVFWHSHKSFLDLKQISDRVTYEAHDRNYTLKMKQVTEEDSDNYRLRVVTVDKDMFSGKPGVVLNVTDLQVRLSHYAVASEEQTAVMLSCVTSCTLSNSPTYVWYKNGRPITDTKNNKLYLISSKDSGNYSCVVKGREDLRSPEQTVAFPDVDNCSGCAIRVPIIIGVTIATILVLMIITGALWMWRIKSKSDQNHDRTEDLKPKSAQVHLSHQDDIHYSSIYFSSSTKNSSLSAAGQNEHTSVQYAEVNFRKPTAAI
ncbi:hypothetical protein Baya_5206 [Bagarius yarrelli]|uniref:Ig-like domain-containing protein n=1 Tax=Bagarius yarrelli TaxID=175774 RepID=A0A556TTU3_BAGYA|nr:hypothetical protein Baya_5206 [Bagarius yarrelli]